MLQSFFMLKNIVINQCFVLGIPKIQSSAFMLSILVRVRIKPERFGFNGSQIWHSHLDFLANLFRFRRL
jgi:hypothetical protein